MADLYYVKLSVSFTLTDTDPTQTHIRVGFQPIRYADRNHFDRLQPATFSELELGQSRYRGQGPSPSV